MTTAHSFHPIPAIVPLAFALFAIGLPAPLNADSPGAFLGISVERAGPALEHQLQLAPALGLCVRAVVAGSPAAVAGIRPHDLLLQLNDQKLFTPEQLQALLLGSAPDTPATLELIRSRKRLTLEVRFVAAAAKPPDPKPVRVTVVRTPPNSDPAELAALIGNTAALVPSGAVDSLSLPAYLGLRWGAPPPPVAAQLDLAESLGALIIAVAPNSPAEQAGLQPYDIILKVGGEDLRGPGDLLDRIGSSTSGAPLVLEVLRHTRSLTLTIAPAMPAADRPAGFDGLVEAESAGQDARLPMLSRDSDWILALRERPAESTAGTPVPSLMEPGIVVVEGDGLSVRVEGPPGSRRITVMDRRGNTLYRGNAETAVDRLQMPPNIQAQVADLMDLSDLTARPSPEVDSDRMCEIPLAPDWL